MIYFFLILFTLASIAFDYYLIEGLKKPIGKYGHWLRGLIHIIVIGGLSCLDTRPYAAVLATFGFSFWFLFDTGLNLVRGQNIMHLGNAFLDQLQKKYPNEGVWFVWKALLAVGFTCMYFGNY